MAHVYLSVAVTISKQEVKSNGNIFNIMYRTWRPAPRGFIVLDVWVCEHVNEAQLSSSR